jgi:hypothetical protein
VARGRTPLARVISSDASSVDVRGHRLGVDLGLLRAGLAIGRGFGLHSLEEMARIALYLESAIYDRGSLREIPGGVTFALHSPPLRMGAFQRAQLHWDARPLAPGRCAAHPAGAPGPLPFDTITRSRPLVLPVGRRVEFSAEMEPPGPGPHTVRLELESVAIPPVVWFQVTDHVHPISESGT